MRVLALWKMSEVHYPVGKLDLLREAHRAIVGMGVPTALEESSG